MLQEMGYDSDPVKAWKQDQEKVRRFDVALNEDPPP